MKSTGRIRTALERKTGLLYKYDLAKEKIGGEHRGIGTIDKTEKKITTYATAGGEPLLREWGPFSGVFDPESTNEAKYKQMNSPESTNEAK